VIIDHGKIALAGELGDLRAAVPQRFLDVSYRLAPAVRGHGHRG
jgi:ABC-2 type transport system ATP-binding protein